MRVESCDMVREARLRRRRIPAAVRSEVLERDGMTCYHCGRTVRRRECPGEPHSPDRIHLDHLIPWAMGGADDATNLVVACAECNFGRARPTKGSAAVNRLLWEKEDGEYYWRDRRYEPPRMTTYRMPEVLFTLAEAAEILTCPVEDVLVRIAKGYVRATTGTSRPIMVAFEGDEAPWIYHRMAELGWEEE